MQNGCLKTIFHCTSSTYHQAAEIAVGCGCSFNQLIQGWCSGGDSVWCDVLWLTQSGWCSVADSVRMMFCGCGSVWADVLWLWLSLVWCFVAVAQSGLIFCGCCSVWADVLWRDQLLQAAVPLTSPRATPGHAGNSNGTPLLIYHH